LIKDESVKERFEEMMGKNAPSFLLSVLNCVQSNAKLAECEPQSILMASAVAGTLGLPIDPNLGMAYIIPYNIKVKTPGQLDRWVKKAQFQIGYKGLIQLGHRSQQFKGLNTSEVRESEYKGVDRETGELDFEWIQDDDAREKLPVIGFVAYFKLVNGFEKSLYMTREKMTAHGQKYSKTFKFGQWQDDFIGMGKKTVLKLLIDKFAPKSVEMQKAIKTDQAIVDDFEGNKLNYIDNDSNKVVNLDDENEKAVIKRCENHISISTTVEMLEQCESAIPNADVLSLFDAKKKELTKK
jgi:recombination protein RecT